MRQFKRTLTLFEFFVLISERQDGLAFLIAALYSAWSFLRYYIGPFYLSPSQFSFCLEKVSLEVSLEVRLQTCTSDVRLKNPVCLCGGLVCQSTSCFSNCSDVLACMQETEVTSTVRQMCIATATHNNDSKKFN